MPTRSRRATAQLPALPKHRRRRAQRADNRCLRPRAALDGRRLPRHAARQPAAARRSSPAFLTITVTDPHGQAGALHPVVRSARARDLLPRGHARLLPHARLRPRRERLHELARRRASVTGTLVDAGEASRRRARPRAPEPGASSCRRERDGRVLTVPFTLARSTMTRSNTRTNRRSLSIARAAVASRSSSRSRRRTRTSARRSSSRRREQVFTLAVPTEKENASTTQDRAHRPPGLLDRLVHPRARLEALGRSRPAPARTP